MHQPTSGRALRWQVCLLGGLAICGLAFLSPLASPAPPPVAEAVPSLSACDAVRWGLERNPELMALRQQHGIAAAAVIIADTYPFNPTYEARVRQASGPASAGITNVVDHEHTLLLELELHGQGRYRRGAANAALSRTDWEIATQELNLAIRVVRAFDTVVYRSEKLQLLEKTVELNRKSAAQVEQLVNKTGRLRPADLIIIRTELQAAQGLLGPGRSALVVASQDLRRALGTVHEAFRLHGQLEMPPGPGDVDLLTQAALERRPELHSHLAAVQEADARLRLEIANRYGNPSFGPTYSMDPTRVNLAGAVLVVPLPVLNQHTGDIRQREAERARAGLELNQTEEQVRQDVQAAVARLEQARAQVTTYQQVVRPGMEQALRDIQTLFEKGDASVDLLRLIDTQRKVIQTRDAELDALFEARQAAADLAAAVGDPGLALGACALPPAPPESIK